MYIKKTKYKFKLVTRNIVLNTYEIVRTLLN